MRKVNREEAIELVNSQPNALVTFVSDHCPVCKKFIPEVLDVLDPQFPHVTMVEVDITNEKKMFGPDIYPSSFAFKNGERTDWMKGAGPLDGVKAKMLQMFPPDSPPESEQNEE